MHMRIALLTVSILAFSTLVRAESSGESIDRPGRTELPAAPVVVPMDMHASQPVVEVLVNGKGPYRFLLDTGAAGCGRVTAEFARELDLPEVGEVIVGDPSGQNVETAKRVGIKSISIGDASFHDLEMVRRDYKVQIDAGRTGISGILGFNLFHDTLLTMDYPNRKLTLEKGTLPAPDGKSVLAFESGHGVPQITFSVGDVEVKGHIDSGSMGGIAIPKSVAKKLHFKSEPVVVGKASTGFNEFEIRSARLDGQVRVGSIVVESPTVEIFDMFSDANLGGRFLQGYRITFDQQNDRLRIVDGSGGRGVQPRYRVGLMMRPDGGSLVVENVLPGPAQSAGLEAGDRIVKVNGESPEDVDLAVVFGSPKPVELTVEREGKERSFTVTPAVAED